MVFLIFIAKNTNGDGIFFFDVDEIFTENFTFSKSIFLANTLKDF